MRQTSRPDEQEGQAGKKGRAKTRGAAEAEEAQLRGGRRAAGEQRHRDGSHARRCDRCQPMADQGARGTIRLGGPGDRRKQLVDGHARGA